MAANTGAPQFFYFFGGSSWEWLTGFEEDLGGLLLNSIPGRLQLALGLLLADFHDLGILRHLFQLLAQLLRT